MRMCWILPLLVLAVGATHSRARQASEDCEKVEADLIGRNPDKECRLPTGVTISGGGRGISMRIRIVSSSQPGALVGMAFGSTESGGDHVFAVSQDGLYQLTQKVSGRVTWLIDSSRSAVIRTGPGSDNQLKVLWTKDGFIRAFINDRYVGGARAVGSLDGGISYYLAGGIRATFGNYTLQNNPIIPPGTPTAGKVLETDDMVSRQNFQVGGGRACRASYDADGYVVENVAARGLCDLPLISLGNFGHQIKIELDAKLRGGPFNQSFGVFFGWSMSNPNPMYAGLIDGQGTFQIARRQGGWQRLTRLLIHDSIRKGQGVWNRLAMVIRDQTIRGFVNGQEVGLSHEASPIEGGIGLYVNEPGMRVVFRNLTITEL